LYESYFGQIDHLHPDPLDHFLVGIGLIFAKDADSGVLIQRLFRK
jgi:hypothetical protein